MNKVNLPIRMLVVGCGNMGSLHAAAYQHIEGFEICGLVATGESKILLNNKLESNYPLFEDYDEALAATMPDAVCIATYPDTHEEFAIKAFANGCHVFIEKPLADTVTGAIRVAEAARQARRKLVVGYILRYHPSWNKFIEVSKSLGKPLVMRMNLNQQSQGKQWLVHQNLMKTLSPIVDCAVHYIDVMCQMSVSKPVQVSAVGARLTNDIPAWNYNYGHLQIKFEDGSVGWYESGWGPMVSETAYFIKDVFGPNGAVSIVANNTAKAGESGDIASHTQAQSLQIHHAAIDINGAFSKKDEFLHLEDEPDQQELCNREQQFFLKSILEDLNLDNPTQDAINSLKIALACDESIRTGQVISL